MKNTANSDLVEWLASYLHMQPAAASKLIQDETVAKFLLVWSLLEVRLFDAFARGRDLEGKAEKLAGQGLDLTPLRRVAERFHERYQDPT